MTATDPHRAMELARKLRADVNASIGELSAAALRQICSRLDVRIYADALVASTTDPEALLVPSHDGGFEILLDTARMTEVRRILGRRRLRFLVAHELAHTYFYDIDQRPPRRLMPTSSAEEDFCTVFADHLLWAERGDSIWSRDRGDTTPEGYLPALTVND